jgi:hypothetical protein
MTGNDLFLLRKLKLHKKDKHGFSVPLSQIDIAKIVGRCSLSILNWERDNRIIPDDAYSLLKKYCTKKGIEL